MERRGTERRAWSPLCYATKPGLVFVCLGVLVEIEFRDRGEGNEAFGLLGLRWRRRLQERGRVTKLREREAAGERGRVDSGIIVFHIRGTTRSRGGGTQKHPISVPWNNAFHPFLAYQTLDGTPRPVPSRPTYQTHP